MSERYAVIVKGPGTGRFFPLPPGRTALSPADLAIGPSTSPSLFIDHHRRHYIVSTPDLSAVFVRRPLYWALAHRPRRTASKILIAPLTQIRIMRRPRRLTWDLKPRRRFQWMYLLALPWLIFMPFVLLRFLPATWRYPTATAIYTTIITVVLSIIMVRRHKYRPPPPFQLGLASASSTASQAHGDICAYRYGRHQLRAQAGESLCFVGAGGCHTMWWWALQLLCDPTRSVCAHIMTDSATCAVGQGSTQIYIDLRRSKDVNAAFSDAIYICHCRTTQGAPLWVQRLITSKKYRGLPSYPWWNDILQRLYQPHKNDASLPSLSMVSDHFDDILGPFQPGGVSTHPFVDGICRSWNNHEGEAGPQAFLGVDATGPVVVHIKDDGPHSLIAGTTGSGKSEALSTWLLSLALRYSPSRLQMILVDYKGGEAFEPLSHLPHVCGVLTDLHPHMVDRALGSVRAELSYREHIARDDRIHGTSHFDKLPWLFIVVDEFQALVTSHPDIMDQLISLATLGRSLSMFLIIATQRPAGIVDGHIRSNMSLRLCLRVREAHDSIDVLGNDKAARLPAVPGRAYLQTDSLTPLHISWLGPHQHDIVTAICDASKQWMTPHALPPWPPPLPTTVFIDQCADVVRDSIRHNPPADSTDPIIIGICDLPDQQCLQLCRLPELSHLLVIGGPGSGKTTTTHSAATLWAAHGWTVHYIGADSPPLPPSTWLQPDNVSLIARMLQRISEDTTLHRVALIIDDCDRVADALNNAYGPLFAEDLFSKLLRHASMQKFTLVMSGDVFFLTRRWASSFPMRMILPLRDNSSVAFLGDNYTLPEPFPGRALFDYNHTRQTIHIVMPTLQDYRTPPPAPRHHTAATCPTPYIRALPCPCVTPADYLGLAGDNCEPFAIGDRRLWLIVGSPGSGKTTAAHVLARHLTDVPITDDADNHLHDVAVNDGAIVTIRPDTFLHSFDATLRELQSRAAIIVLGQACRDKSIVPPAYQSLVPVGAIPPGRGVLNCDGIMQAIHVST